MADYIGSLNGRLNGEKTLEKKNEIYVKKIGSRNLRPPNIQNLYGRNLRP